MHVGCFSENQQTKDVETTWAGWAAPPAQSVGFRQEPPQHFFLSRGETLVEKWRGMGAKDSKHTRTTGWKQTGADVVPLNALGLGCCFKWNHVFCDGFQTIWSARTFSETLVFPRLLRCSFDRSNPQETVLFELLNQKSDLLFSSPQSLVG